MKIFKIIMRVVLLLLTAIFGLGFNVLGGIAMIVQNTDGAATDTAKNSVVIIGIVMLCATVICFVGGTVLVMLNKSFIAAILSVIGAATMLVLYAQFSAISLESAADTSARLFMNNHLPSLLITIATIILAFAENYKKLGKRAEARRKADNAPAPSILGGSFSAENKTKQSENDQ